MNLHKEPSTFVASVRLDIKKFASFVLYLEDNGFKITSKSSVIRISLELLYSMIIIKNPLLELPDLSTAIEVIKASGLYDPLYSKNINFNSLVKELELEDSTDLKPASDSLIRSKAEQSLAQEIAEEIEVPTVRNIRKGLKELPDIVEEWSTAFNFWMKEVLWTIQKMK